MENTEKKESLVLFLKWGSHVKKAEIDTQSLCELIPDLRKLFLTKFSKAGFNLEPTTPLYIQHQSSRTWHELENIADLYNHCVIEVRTRTDDSVSSVRKITGYYGLQRDKIVFVMVGLPARGKTYIARKIERYVNWLGVPTKLFNVGNYRRKFLGAKQPTDFFDPDNKQGRNARLHVAVLALDDMFEWLTNKGGMVAIYDATNSTQARRSLILGRCKDELVKVIFLESICESPAIIQENLKQTKLLSPDFEGVSAEEAMKQFETRIAHYKKAYEPVADTEGSYVKLFDVGAKIVVHNLPNSYLPGRIVFYLMNLHIVPRPIWLTRHGQSEDNVRCRLGGDSALSTKGEGYAKALADWVADTTQLYPNSRVNVWTSTLHRSLMTSQYIPRRKVHLRALDEIDAGKCEGFTYDEVAQQMPEEYASRAADKLRYRYPGGESYEDVIQRLEPVIFELERQREPILIISHNAVLRCLYAYLMNKSPEEVPHIDIPLHTVIELIPRAYGCEEKRYNLDDKCYGS